MKFAIVLPSALIILIAIGSNIRRILFSNTLSLHSSPKIIDHASQPYSTTVNIIVLGLSIIINRSSRFQYLTYPYLNPSHSLSRSTVSYVHHKLAIRAWKERSLIPLIRTCVLFSGEWRMTDTYEQAWTKQKCILKNINTSRRNWKLKCVKQ